MRSITYALLTTAFIATRQSLVDASSSRRNPIGAITTVQNATIHTYNHRVTALSEFDLSFTLQDELNVKFTLEPSHDILGDDALITYLSPDGTIRHAESVDRLSHKVYRGEAWIQRRDTAAFADSSQLEYWSRAGWARVTVLQDGLAPVFEGAFSVDFDSHHIQTAESYARTRHYDDPEFFGDDSEIILWRDSDILPNSMYQQQRDLKRSAEPDSQCVAEQLSFNSMPVFAAMEKRSNYLDFSHLFKRQTDTTTSGNGAGVNLTSTIGQSDGCPNTRKVALVGVATDCTYTAALGSSQAVRSNVISQINQASAIWETAFNISLGLQNLTISDANCPSSPATASQWNQACNSNVDISARLNYFSAWRGNQADTNSHWTLLSTCNTGSAVGLAWLGQACIQGSYTNNGSSSGSGDSSTGGSETVAGANVVIRTSGAAEWQIIAHETGHTYGAVHDCTSDTCKDADFVNSQQCCPLSSGSCDAGGKYIMNPSTGSGITQFSLCSVGNICSAIGRNSVKTFCLSNNKQVTTVSGQSCGNGIVEPGEDCDCGGDAGCGNNKCCDPTTCKFTTGSVCDDSNEECCHNCQLASNGTVCRATTGACDPAETCTGSSPVCPADTTTPDGTSCGDGLTCASGHCTSRDQQCRTVMGSYTQSNNTYACDDTSCVITCASPKFGQGVCYGLPQNYLDGTLCGSSGTCQNGRCTNQSSDVVSWINGHKGVVIGVSVAVGTLVVIALLACLIACCRRRKQPKVIAPPPRRQGWQGWCRQQPQMTQSYYNMPHPVQPQPAYIGRSVRYA